MSTADISYTYPVNFLPKPQEKQMERPHISCKIFLFLQKAFEPIEPPSHRLLVILQECGVCLAPKHTALE